MSDLLARYEPPWTFAHQGISHPIYSTGRGRTVVVLHELPGMIEQCLDLGLILGERFRVHLPLLLGEPGKWAMAMNIARLCVSHEIHAFAAHKTSPLVGWLRALCRKLKDDSGEAGVGVGRRFTLHQLYGGRFLCPRLGVGIPAVTLPPRGPGAPPRAGAASPSNNIQQPAQ